MPEVYGPPAPRVEHPYKQTVPDAERLRRKLYWERIKKKLQLIRESQQSPLVQAAPEDQNPDVMALLRERLGGVT
jgi:hypothetical protein